MNKLAVDGVHKIFDNGKKFKDIVKYYDTHGKQLFVFESNAEVGSEDYH